MKARLSNFWEALHSSFWFIPAVMTAGIICLSFTTIAFDAAVRERLLEKIELVWVGGADGARELLSAIAASMITVAGVVFSITIVVLTLASSQFGPRLLRSFMRDRGNQIVLGTFIATFTYCLLVLRSIRSDGRGDFVPYISVTLGIILALLSVAVLIYFIHHIAVMIQAPTVIAIVADELDQGIERLFPEKLGDRAAQRVTADPLIPSDFESRAKPIAATDDGYIQTIDSDGLLDIAKKKELLLRLNYRPGDFVVQGDSLLIVWPAERVQEETGKELNDAIIVGADRSPTQDLKFTIDQLVEVAVRALSTGINDPFTAINCRSPWRRALPAGRKRNPFRLPLR
jgi:uncharacterized membrane protein